MFVRLILLLSLAFALLLTTACQSTASTDINTSSEVSSETLSEGLTLEYSMDLEYAELFSVDYYSGGYKIITIEGDQKFITIPQGKDVPEDIEQDMTVIQLPIESSLVTSTATMSLISALGETDKVSQTTYDYDSWYIDSVKTQFELGEMTYIGSYREPDYEKIVGEAPAVVVYNTALYSIQDVMEKINEIGIPLIIDHSSTESHPLARVEWIKLYGALFDLEEKADELFSEQVSYVESIPAAETEKEDKTASIFYVNSNGEIVVRNGGDYISAMYEIAGGEYALADFNPDESGVTTITMEEFYAEAHDAEYMIYLWSRGGEPGNISELIDKNSLLADFKAVKEGNVWCTTPDFFQIADTIGYMMKDMNSLLNMEQGSGEELTYLFKLEE